LRPIWSTRCPLTEMLSSTKSSPINRLGQTYNAHSQRHQMYATKYLLEIPKWLSLCNRG
jgi:hypothetical protein